MTDKETKAQSGPRQSLELHSRLWPFLPWLSAPLSHSDVRFVVGQEQQEVFAHRCLLACRCNFFQRLLGQEPGPGVPSPVVLSTVPAEAFLAVLEFLYTNSVKLHRHSVSPVGRGLGGRGTGAEETALRLQPPTLQVLEVLTAAVEYGLEELREVGLCGRVQSCFLCLYELGAYPASHTLCLGEEHVPIQKYGYLCIIGIYAPLCAKRYVHGLCAVGAHGVCTAGAVDTKIRQL